MSEIKGTTVYRTVTIDADQVRSAEGPITAALSSESPVSRHYGTEILNHDSESINMERAKEGLPLLFSHNHEELIGSVRNIRVDTDRVLRGELSFSKSARAADHVQDVRDGFLKDVSIGYRIDEYTEEDNDVIRVTRWTPLESSLVTVPADSRVGINRKHEDAIMTDEVNKPDAADSETRQPASVGSELKLFKLNQEKERKQGALLEAKRREEIGDLFDRYEDRYGDAFSDLRRACEASTDVDVTKAKDALLEYIADGHVSVQVAQRQEQPVPFKGGGNKFGQAPRIERGGDQWDKFERAMSLSLSVQAGNKVDQEDLQEVRQTEWYSMSVTDMARNYLRMCGERAVGEKHQIIGKAFMRSPTQGTGHFSSVLENVANKAMLEGFSDSEQTWSRWANTKSIPDFKQASLLNLSLFTDLEEVPELAQYEHGQMSDIKEVIQLLTYGRLFGISRQALSNDDLSALGDAPRAMGAAGNRKIGDLVYAVLTTGTTVTMLQDSTAIFDAATHGNYVTSGAAPSVTTVNAAKVAMATQTDPEGKTIGLRPVYLIVPVALETTADVLRGATYDPAAVAGTLTPNPFQNTFEVIADHRLDTFNSSGWFMAARTNQVVVGFLNGQQQPMLESQDGWTIDGVEYKVRVDCAATAADFRGLYYNDGVT